MAKGNKIGVWVIVTFKDEYFTPYAYCDHCGKIIENGFGEFEPLYTEYKYCPYCGNPKAETPRIEYK